MILKEQSKEDFLGDKNSSLREAFTKAELRVHDFWDKLVDIDEAYCEADFIETDMQEFVKCLGIQPFFHSIRYRRKSEESLLKKIIMKSGSVPVHKTEDSDIEKYRDINKDNYRAIFTDLIGVRIIYRYPYQWPEIHKFLKEKFFPKENYTNKFILNWGDINNLRTDIKEYLAERPKIYTSKTDRFFYDKIHGIENVYILKDSNGCYNSTHYIIKYRSSFIELQVRTILDEVWGECSHDFSYKPDDSVDENKREQMDSFLEILSAQNYASEKTIEKMCIVDGHSLDDLSIDEKSKMKIVQGCQLKYCGNAFKKAACENKGFSFGEDDTMNFITCAREDN